jgi:hypothetical protein
MNRRIFAQGAFSASAATLTLLLTRAPAAFADDWCSSDPLVRVVTRGGNKEYVHVTLYALGLQHRRELRRATISWTAVPATEGTSTDVKITATVPRDESGGTFPTKMLVSTRTFGKGTVLGQDDTGKAGEAMEVAYNLAVR